MKPLFLLYFIRSDVGVKYIYIFYNILAHINLVQNSLLLKYYFTNFEYVNKYILPDFMILCVVKDKCKICLSVCIDVCSDV